MNEKELIEYAELLHARAMECQKLVGGGETEDERAFWRGKVAAILEILGEIITRAGKMQLERLMTVEEK